MPGISLGLTGARGSTEREIRAIGGEVSGCGDAVVVVRNSKRIVEDIGM